MKNSSFASRVSHLASFTTLAAATGLAPRIAPALLLAALGGYALPAQAEDPLRAPDYAEATGNDWLYNHAIAGKEYEGEAAETGVDLFYVYPTLTGGEIVIDGFRGIDDAAMRGDEVPSFATAKGGVSRERTLLRGHDACLRALLPSGDAR